MKKNIDKCCINEADCGLCINKRYLGFLISAVEWYDFAIYAVMINTISKIFFTQYSVIESGVYTFGIFSIAYLFRPAGSYLFARIAFRDGLQKSLQYSLMLMGLTNLGLAILPVNSMYGIYMLIGLRVLQGMAMGGCYGMSYTYVIANAKDGEKNYHASFVCLGFIIGFTLGKLMHLVLKCFGSIEKLWRIAFASGAVVSLIVLWLIYINDDSKKEIKLELNKYENDRVYDYRYYKLIISSILIIGLDMIGFYMLFIYNPYILSTYMFNTASIGIMNIEWMDIYTICMLLMLWPVIIVCSKLADKYGGMMILILSNMMMMGMVLWMPWYNIYMLLGALLALGACYGSLPVMIVERLGYDNEAIGLSFNIASSVFTSSISMLMPICMSYNEYAFKYILITIMLIILLILIFSDNGVKVKKEKKCCINATIS